MESAFMIFVIFLKISKKIMLNVMLDASKNSYAVFWNIHLKVFFFFNGQQY